MTPKEIIHHYDDITLAKSSEATQGKFCEIWPKVKEGLELLQKIIKNPIAKAAVGIVIGAGDAVAKNLCG
jgi:hypothetical protein